MAGGPQFLPDYSFNVWWYIAPIHPEEFHLHKYVFCFSYMFLNVAAVSTVSLLADYFRINYDESAISTRWSPPPRLLSAEKQTEVMMLKCRNSVKSFSPHYLVWCEVNERIPARAGKASTRQRESCSMPPEFNSSTGAQLPAPLHTSVLSLVQFAKLSVAICDHLALCLLLAGFCSLPCGAHLFLLNWNKTCWDVTHHFVVSQVCCLFGPVFSTTSSCSQYSVVE